MASLANQDFSVEKLQEIALLSAHYGAAHGIQLISPTQRGPGSSTNYVVAPYTCVPTETPAAAFEQGKSLQTIFNKLTHNIANDVEFLLQCLCKTCGTDEFTANLCQILRDVRATSTKSVLRMGYVRNDFMLHQQDGELQLRQVEINTISASFAMLSSRISSMHRLMHSRFSDPAAPGKVPENQTQTAIPSLFNAAMNHYVHTFPDVLHTAGKSAQKPVMVMVVQSKERNVVDQRHLEFALWEQYAIRTVRLSLLDISQHCQIASNGAFILTTSSEVLEIGIVYFRGGYCPADLSSEIEWAARGTIEKSRAIKCPDIALHLAGTKKVQQVLAVDGVLERFLPADEAALVRTTFAGLYSLDAEEYPNKQEGLDLLISHVRANPHKYVLKPQREGGGNNVYGAAVAAALETMSLEERKAYILMERINTPAFPALLLVDKEVPLKTNVTTELGFYGVFLAQGDEFLVNEYAGHMMRTKPANVDEAGVMAGFGCLDSPLLV